MKATIITLVVFSGLLIYFNSAVRAENSARVESNTDSGRSGDLTGTVEIETSRSRDGSPEPSETPEPSESPEPSETPRVRGIDRLKNLRLNFCEDHQGEIENRLTSLGNLVASMLGKFDAIAVKVEGFYTTKVVPTGKTISNYSELTADIEAKRAAVETALANSQNDVTGFTCTGENPKGQIRLYRTDMQLVKKALHDYRTSIKNLIVAIRSVVGETNRESPEPSESPTASPVSTATP